MKITELTAIHVRIPLRKPIRHASHTREATDNLVVRCQLADGTVGHGEGVPREYVTGETIDSAIELLQRTDLQAQLEPCADFEAAVRMAERLTLAEVPGDERRCQGNAARCAVELALLDAFGQKFGQPVSAATRLLAPDCHHPRARVQYSGAITSAQGGMKLRFAAWRMRIYGFNQIKVKVGIEGHDDPYRLGIIRGRIGKRDLRIDANEAWSAEEAADRIAALEPHGISSVEQPIAHESFDRLAELRRRVKTPIMLDESLCSAVDAERAIAAQACDFFNIRLSKCGGLIPSLRLVQQARRHGLGYQLGCQVGETAILSAAGRHFASSVADIRYLEGSYDRHLVKEALGRDDLTFGWGGWAPALTTPGLGVRIDPLALQRVLVRQVRLIG